MSVVWGESPTTGMFIESPEDSLESLLSVSMGKREKLFSLSSELENKSTLSWPLFPLTFWWLMMDGDMHSALWGLSKWRSSSGLVFSPDVCGSGLMLASTDWRMEEMSPGIKLLPARLSLSSSEMEVEDENLADFLYLCRWPRWYWLRGNLKRLSPLESFPPKFPGGDEPSDGNSPW